MPKEKTLRKLNQITLKAKLNFNVNVFKTWMKKKLQDEGKTFEKDGKQCLPKFSGSHIAIAALNEKLCYIILDKTINRLKKEVNGLYVIKFLDISDIVHVDQDLKHNIANYMDMFDSTLSYKDQYCIEEKCIKKYIDDMFGKSIDIQNDAFNLLVYILHKVSVQIIDTAFIMIKFAKKRSLSPNAIIGSVSAHFAGSIEHLLKLRIDEAIKSCGRDMDEKDVDMNKEENEEEDVEKESNDPVVVEEKFEVVDDKSEDDLTSKSKKGKGKKGNKL